MESIKILKPKVPGEFVRDPVTKEKLPAEGKAVKMTTFWRRRLEDGSVVEVLPTVETKSSKKEKESDK